MPHRARSWFLLSAFGLALFLTSWSLRPIDLAVGRAVVGHPALFDVAGGLGYLGAIAFIGPLLLGAGVALFAVGRRWGALRIVLVPLLADAVTLLLKALFARPRPEYMLVETGGYSFPSGHATTGAALAVLLAWFALRNLQGRGYLIAGLSFAVAWASAMALSRMVLGAHYLSDVVGGVGVGTCVAAGALGGTIVLERRLAESRVTRRQDRTHRQGSP